MEIRLSKNLETALPSLRDEIRKTAKLAAVADRDLNLDDLYIQARCSRHYESIWGNAWPEETTYLQRTGKTIQHPSGKITMSVGIWTEELVRVGVIAHELRHIAQFHRGWIYHNEFGAEYMGRKCEPDANEFEELVKARYRRRKR